VTRAADTHIKYRWILVASVFALCVLLLLVLKFGGGIQNRYNRSSPLIMPSLSDYNLIVINIDALRADHLSCYGYFRKTSPFIDTMADEGLVFENAFSNSSYTRESVVSLFSGRLPSSSGGVGWVAVPPEQIKNMGMLFKDAGYQTALLSNSHQLHHQNFHQGFSHVDVLFSKWQGVSRNAPKLTAQAAAFAERNRDRRFMMYLHYLDPHGPYDPPLEFYQRFEDHIFEDPVVLYSFVRNNCQLLIEEGFGPGEDRFEDLVLRYDAEIAFVDHSLEALFRRLRELDLLEKTMVVLTADHGQEFLEHDYVEHAWTLYQESLHIPLIFWAPGKIKPGRIDPLVSTVDVLPTLLDLLEISHDRVDFDGAPLFRYEGTGFYFSPPEKPYIAEVLIQHRSLIRTVIQGPWKYIAAQRWLIPPERPGALSRPLEIEENRELHLNIWGPIVHEELYDLTNDTGEEHALPMNKAGRKLRGILDEYRSFCQQHGLKADPGSRKAALSEEEIENLRSLGYIK